MSTLLLKEKSEIAILIGRTCFSVYGQIIMENCDKAKFFSFRDSTLYFYYTIIIFIIHSRKKS